MTKSTSDGKVRALSVVGPFAGCSKKELKAILPLDPVRAGIRERQHGTRPRWS
jgi:hypothetical protein